MTVMTANGLNESDCLTPDDGAKNALPLSVSEILARSGISALTGASSAEAVESALRRLRKELVGVDALREGVVRGEVVKHLVGVGIQSPAQLVAIALARPEKEQDIPRMAFPESEPWPHPVDGSRLLDEISGLLCRFVVLPVEEIRVVALWVVHTYAVDAASICPILVVKSTEKRCGKTLLLELLHSLVFRPLPTSNITASALFRAIGKYHSTLLLDEADTFLGEDDALRGVLNSGYRRSSAYIVRTVGDDFEPVVFDTFGPKAVAQIGTPQETVVDRGIVVEMRRKKPGDMPERMRSDRIFDDCKELRRRIVRWARDNVGLLSRLEPEIPQSLNDRARDSWRPLLAIAEAAGAEWVAFGRECAGVLSGSREATVTSGRGCI